MLLNNEMKLKRKPVILFTFFGTYVMITLIKEQKRLFVSHGHVVLVNLFKKL